MWNIVKEKPGPKGNGCQADTDLKSFELFFDDAMITEIATWTNQKIENVKTSYTSKPGFLYNTSVIEIRALIGILLFLGATKSSKESTASIWAKDGTGKPICIAAMSQKRFLFLVYCLRLLWRFNHEGQAKNRWQVGIYSQHIRQICRSLWSKLHSRNWLHNWWISPWMQRNV